MGSIPNINKGPHTYDFCLLPTGRFTHLTLTVAFMSGEGHFDSFRFMLASPGTDNPSCVESIVTPRCTERDLRRIKKWRLLRTPQNRPDTHEAPSASSDAQYQVNSFVDAQIGTHAHAPFGLLISAVVGYTP
jgi:hypothetical protein